MIANFWPWLTQTDEGLLTRIAAGVIIFTILALLDLRRHGRRSRRWREYMILLSAVGVALVYGVVNDQITCRISWEYFFYGKGLFATLGTGDLSESQLQWEALKIGLKATWTVGLLFGVAVLFANNPRKSTPPLPDREIYRMLPLPLICAVLVAAILGAAAALLPDVAVPLVPDLTGMHFEKSRAVRYACVEAIHLGGYIGAAVGCVIVVRRILRRRKQQQTPAA